MLYHGRAAPGTEGLVGCLSDNVPVRLDVPRGISLGALLRSVEQICDDALRHAATPYQQILTVLPRRSGGLYQTVFGWQAKNGWLSAEDWINTVPFGDQVQVRQAEMAHRGFSEMDLQLEAHLTWTGVDGPG